MRGDNGDEVTRIVREEESASEADDSGAEDYDLFSLHVALFVVGFPFLRMVAFALSFYSCS